MSEDVEPFHIQVEESVLEDLRHRLALTRFPDDDERTAWPARYAKPAPKPVAK